MNTILIVIAIAITVASWIVSVVGSEVLHRAYESLEPARIDRGLNCAIACKTIAIIMQIGVIVMLVTVIIQAASGTKPF